MPTDIFDEVAAPSQPKADIFDQISEPAEPASLQGSPQDIASRALAQQKLPPAAPPAAPPQPKTVRNLTADDIASALPSEGGRPSYLSGAGPEGEQGMKQAGEYYTKAGPGEVVGGLKEWATGEAMPGSTGLSQRYHGLARAIGGAGMTMLPYAGPALAAAPISTVAAFGSGAVLGPAARKAAEAAGASPQQASLVEQLGYWSPGMFATLGGLRTDLSPEGDAAVASILGDRAAVGVAKNPEGGVTVAGRAGERSFRKTFGGKEPAGPGIEPQTIKAEPGAVSKGDVFDEVSPEPKDIRAQAVKQQPETVKTAENIAEQVPGAKVVDPGAKPQESIERKADSDRPITDASRAQIVVPDQATKQQAVQTIAQQTPAHEIKPIEADSLPIVAAKLPNSQEIQVATEAEHQAQAETHPLYQKVQEAKAAGNDAEATKLQKQLDDELASRQKQAAAQVQTIAGKMDLDEFERKGYSPDQVTREDWTNLQRATRRALGQREESGTKFAPYSDYEEYHKQAVKDALARGEEVDPEVLKDYPELQAQAQTQKQSAAAPQFDRDWAESALANHKNIKQGPERSQLALSRDPRRELVSRYLDRVERFYNDVAGHLPPDTPAVQNSKEQLDQAKKALAELDNRGAFGRADAALSFLHNHLADLLTGEAGDSNVKPKGGTVSGDSGGVHTSVPQPTNGPLKKGDSVTLDGKPGKLTYLSKQGFEKSRVRLSESGKEVEVPHREVSRRIQPVSPEKGAGEKSAQPKQEAPAGVIRVYRGTASGKPEGAVSTGGAVVEGLGKSYSESRDVAASYPPTIREGQTRQVTAHDLNIQNPKSYRSMQALSDDVVKRGGTEKFKAELRAAGHDGVTFPEGKATDTSQGKAPVYIPFDENQVSSVSESTTPQSTAGQPVQGVTSGTPSQPTPKPGAIAVDLDKTLATYEDGDAAEDPTKIGAPIQSTVDHVKQLLKDGKDVWVFSARATSPEVVDAIKAWTKEHIGQELPVTNIKHPTFAQFIDDRAVTPEQATAQQGETNAIREQGPAGLLQREPQETGEAGSGRGRVERGQQGQETSSARAEVQGGGGGNAGAGKQAGKPVETLDESGKLREGKVREQQPNQPARATGETESVPRVSEPSRPGGNAPAAVSTEGNRPTGEAEETPRDVGQPDRERVERIGGRETVGNEPARGGGSSPAEHPASERAPRRTGSQRGEGADGKPIESPPPEPAEDAQKTTAELRNQRNYHISDEEAEQIGKGGEITKIKGNLDALETLKKIQSEGRETATPEEQNALAKYVDFGGLVGMLQNQWDPKWAPHYKRFTGILSRDEIQEIRETLPNTHYTSLQMVDWMWDAMKRMGFRGGRILEPGMGIGNFYGRMPKAIGNKSELFGVERNPLTGQMAKLLYPDAKIIVKPFQQFVVPDNSMDAIIGNVPFQDFDVTDDPLYRKLKLNLHNYFIVKSLDKLRPGGIASLITSRYTMDNTTGKGQRAREEMAKRADLIAAIRLPNKAFKGNAGTEVVADLLVFRKRDPNDVLEKMPDWTTVAPIKAPEVTRTIEPRYAWGEKQTVTSPEKEFMVNKYFVDHPDNVLGQHSQEGSMYRQGEYTVNAPADFDAALEKAADLIPERAYGKKAGQRIQTVAPEQTAELNLAPEDVKPGAFYLDDKGDVKIKEAGVGATPPPELRTKAAIDHIKSAIGLRTQLNKLIDAQLASGDDEAIKPEQKKLETLYDKYRKDYGSLHGPKLKAVFGNDPEYPKLLALENRDPETKQVAKADIFTKRVLAPYNPLHELPDDPKAAMAKVMAERGYLDTKLMADLLGKPEGEVVSSLEKQGLIFQDPQSGKHYTADEYLSGDVRNKLRLAERAADTDDKYKANVDALKKAQPAPLTIHEIQPALGQTWIPIDIYKSFVKRLMGQGVNISKINIEQDASGKWLVQAPGGVVTQWDGGGIAAHKLVQSALNQQLPTVYYRDEHGNPKMDAPATAAARDKLEAIKEEFRTVLRKAPQETVEKLEQIYNDTFNGHKLREFSGEHLDFPGMSREWQDKIRGYQKAMVWRILQEGRAGIFHAPGLGKTLTMATAGMEARRLKLSRKNIYAVPNHMVPQWREDFKRFYPNANVLAVQDEDFTPTNRAKLMSRIATGDWDAVILPHSQFDLLPMSAEWESKTINKRLQDYREVLSELDPDDRSNQRTIKQIEKAVDKLESRLNDLNAKKKDNAISFDKLGADMLFVDEAHAYKSMAVPSKMGNIGGISNSASQRAFALEMKADFMRETHRGRGLVFATGTPITNTVGELYVMTKYLAPEILEEQGIRSFDDWAANFATAITNFVYSPDGVTFKPKTTLSEYVNVPELSTAFRRYAEYLSKGDAKKLSNLKEPEDDRKDVMLTITPVQEPLLEEIAERGDRLTKHPPRTKEERQQDNWLKLSSDARKISLDPRLYDPDLRDHPESKANKAVEVIKQVLDESKAEKGTVVVFSDFFQHKDATGKSDFNLFEDMRKKLVKAGVPKDQIAIIHDVGDDKEAKEALFANVRSGKVRVLFGSTDKMGIGTNVQDRLKAELHLDQPWRPDQVEQREGRIIRSGNMWDRAQIYRFIAEPRPGKITKRETVGFEMDADGKERPIYKDVEVPRPVAYDLQMYQQLERKAQFQEQFLTGQYKGRTMEDTGGDVKLNSQMFAVAKAAATGNPDAMRKLKLEHDLRTQEMLDHNFEVQRSKDTRYAANLELRIPLNEKRVEMLKADAARWEKAEASEDGPSIKFGDVDLKTKKERDEYFKANPDILDLVGKRLQIGGIDTTIEATALGNLDYRLAGEEHGVPYDTEKKTHHISAFLNSFAGRARSLGRLADTIKEDVAKDKENLAALHERLKEKSPYAPKVEAMHKELQEINKRLGVSDQNVEKDEGAETEAPPEQAEKEKAAKASGGGLAASEEGFFAPKAVLDAVKAIDKAYDRVADAALQKIHMGRGFPEVERADPKVAADLRELAAAPQYYRAKADAIVQKITQGMTREQEKGFVLLADKDSRDWLRENKPNEYRSYIHDDRITQALQDYKPYEDDLRQKQKALGGPTIDEDYLRRVYAEHVAGVGGKNAAGESKTVNANRVITPQMANKKGRIASAEYYYNNGLHEFGPSFATRYVATNLKLAEHHAAIDFLSKATKIENKDGLPETIDYNGQTYFRPDVARLIKESASDSEEGKQIAESLGLEQLPKPSNVKEYSLYDPTPADKSDYQAKKLAQKLQEAAQNASGTKLREEDLDELLKQSAAISHSNHPLYAGPKDIVEAFQSGAKHAIPGWLRDLGSIISPVSGMVRRQVIGLGFGVPHIKNILRRVMETSPGSQLDPRSYARAAKVLLSNELRQRGVKGVDDPAFDALLKHAGISNQGVESYKAYVNSNTDAGRMERAWNVIKASKADYLDFEKRWLQDIKAAHREGGFVGNAKAAATALAGAVETPLRPLMFMGHHAIFGPGGIDQKSRLWLYDLIKAQNQNITDDEMAHRINDQLGRYNKASWTDFQKDVQPFTFFPGWDYSSVAWVLRHPLRGVVPAAMLILLANQVLNKLGKNKRKDSTDLSRVHVGNYSISDNIFAERLARAVAGSGMRFASAEMRGKSAEEGLRDALAGVPSDARAFVNMANPLNPFTLAAEVGTGKELGSGKDIVPQGDRGHRGKPEKDYFKYAARKLFPAYTNLASPEQGTNPATFALRNLGTTVFKNKRKSR